MAGKSANDTAHTVDGADKHATNASQDEHVWVETGIPPTPFPHAGSKRPAEGELMEDNPAVKKRNRRLFGALLGTLQKFK